MTNNLVGSIDLVEILFTLFWVFFAVLVFYLQREARREGFPLVEERAGNVVVHDSPDVVSNKKVFLTPHHGEMSVPRAVNHAHEHEIAARPAVMNANSHMASAGPGAPIVPTGDPLVDGIGPAAWSDRADTPDLTLDGQPRIVPMRNQSGFAIDSRDPDPRGRSVVTADGRTVGSVADAWIDVPEPMIVYLEVALDASVGTGNVLVPFAFADIRKSRESIEVSAVLAEQFARAPRLQNADTITLLEEEKVQAYFGGGALLATPERSEPLL